ncbi:PEP-dependent dihydroxyacetone kinase, ADP-binding subunit DhaL [Sodalis praecaptivus]|uniref:dihydroxyacetone kinase subunit DhaL n=1 Tax=Sodalis praecaptivus TaxID=1239307 RepID=UPI0027F1B17A|nr:dihydroxyacetone kinase subunit DhaL [Sodalis praecaptivus]CAJ1000347.1 PEP-dependent dihydroxyacetone kinase, ADP-binding subunit DhaL [Sodalis praecaptivus]
MSFANKDGLLIAKNMVAIIQENKAWLSEIDGAAGDGDHGINMSKGFTLAAERLTPAMNMSDAFLLISQILMGEIGGSMGPLYGSWFRGLSRASAGRTDLDAAALQMMFDSSLTDLRALTSAQIGDKTLLDVLVPSVEAFGEAIATGASEDAALIAMKTAAQTGFDATRAMQARIGHASHLGERSIGHPDAGAGSCLLLLSAFADTAISLINQGKKHATTVK